MEATNKWVITIVDTRDPLFMIYLAFRKPNVTQRVPNVITGAYLLAEDSTTAHDWNLCRLGGHWLTAHQWEATKKDSHESGNRWTSVQNKGFWPSEPVSSLDNQYSRVCSHPHLVNPQVLIRALLRNELNSVSSIRFSLYTRRLFRKKLLLGGTEIDIEQFSSSGKGIWDYCSWL